MFFLALILLNACQSSDSKEIEFNEDETTITLVTSEGTDLLVVDYTITNKTEESSGPFYTKIIFHDETISNLVGITESSQYKRIGNKESIININKGESFRSGESFKLNGNYLVDNLREIIEKTNSVGIQLINLENEDTAINYWIHKVEIKN